MAVTFPVWFSAWVSIGNGSWRQGYVVRSLVPAVDTYTYLVHEPRVTLNSVRSTSTLLYTNFE